MNQLPQYRSHKVVGAFMIGSIVINFDETEIKLIPALAEVRALVPFVIVGDEYYEKHNPQISGYYVRYEDGYESWSPAAAFEFGYTAV